MDRIIPAKISAGLTFSAVAALSAYPAPAWSMTLALRGPASIDLEATADGTSHALAATAEETGAYPPGLYRYSLRALYNGVVREIEHGTINVLADLVQLQPGTETRSHARIVLDNIQAVIEKRATQDQQKYTINNRELWRTPIADLLKLKNLYLALVRQEEKAASGKNTFGLNVRMRLG